MEDIGTLMEQIDTEDLEILVQARADARDKVKKDPSRANLEALKTATRMLKEVQNSDKSTPEPVYNSRAEALKELKAQEYKIGKSKFYKDCTQGLCKMEADGRVLEKSLANYIKHPRSGLKRLDKIVEEGTASEKTQAEIEKLKTQVKLLQHDLAIKEGRYISHEDFEMELASVVGYIQTSLQNMFEMRAAGWVALVNGESNKTKALADAGKQDLDDRFNDLAKIDRFKVVFEVENAPTNNQ